MSLKVNLLPEAKLASIENRNKRQKYTSLTLLIGSIVASIIIVLSLLIGYLLSTYQINVGVLNNLNNEISKSRDLEENASTLQNNLGSFYALNNNRTYASRIFTNLSNAIPSGVSINNLQINNDERVTISAKTNSFAEVSKTSESLKQYNINYKPQPDLERKPIFTDVNIDSISKSELDGVTVFTLSFKVDNSLLKNQKEVKQ